MQKNTKKIIQKISLMLVILILFNFTIPVTSNAGLGGKIVGLITQPIKALFVIVFDSALHLVESSLIGWGPVDWNWEEAKNNNVSGAHDFETGSVEIPNIMVSPDEIFTNRVPALNANFIDPINTSKFSNNVETEDDILNGLVALRVNIASWYKAIRYIALVGLMSVLVYIGIRMVISGVAADKAKYKKMLMDWVVALCLIFLMHYIMAFTMSLTESITNLFTGGDGQKIGLMENDTLIKNNGGETVDSVDNLMEYVRVYVQLQDLTQAFTFVIVYMVLVIYTVYFVFVYIKRFLYLAFLTVISPFVALTYPIDKVNDGQAQAFNTWLKEYMYNALLQPFHCLIYTIFVTMALQLAATSLIYTCVVIGFMIPAEKFLKKMFGFDKASTTSPIGAFATGAAMNKVLTNMKSGSSRNNSNNGGNAPQQPKFKTQRNTYGGFMQPGSGAGEGTSDTGNTSQQTGGNAPGQSSGNRLPQNSQQGNGQQTSNNRPETNSTDSWSSYSGYNGYDSDDGGTGGLFPNVTNENDLRSQDVTSRLETADNSGQTENNSLEQLNNTSNVTDEGPTIDNPRTNGGALKAMFANTGRNIKNNAGTLLRNKGEYAGKAGKWVAKKAGRGVLRALGTAALGTVGLAAGIATGDPSKAFAMAGLGMAAGWNSGGRISDKIGKNVAKPIANSYRVAKYGAKGAAEKEDKEAYLKDKNRVQRFKDFYAQNFDQKLTTTQAKEKMKEAYNYRRMGMDDESALKAMKFKEKVLDQEKKQGKINLNENQMRSMAAMTASTAQMVSGESLTDDKKFRAHRERIKNEILADESLNINNDQEAYERADQVLQRVAQYHDQDPNTINKMVQRVYGGQTTSRQQTRQISESRTSGDSTPTAGRERTEQIPERGSSSPQTPTNGEDKAESTSGRDRTTSKTYKHVGSMNIEANEIYDGKRKGEGLLDAATDPNMGKRRRPKNGYKRKGGTDTTGYGSGFERDNGMP